MFLLNACYLPEYRAVRAKAGSFLDLCYTPQFASDVTLQPIRRFDFDAAILFSDILVIPHALGQRVDFIEGRGPVLDPIDLNRAASLNSEQVVGHLEPVLETVRLVREELAQDKALIGFCGAPWTVATYMIAGEGTPDQGPARRAMYGQRDAFSDLIDVLIEASSRYLIAQLRAGADCVQIFDSWAGVLDSEEFEQWAIEPARRIVERVRAEVPDAPIIVFAKGAGSRIGAYAKGTGANAVGLDWTLPIKDAVRDVSNHVAIQGNLDPMRLIVGGEALDHGVDAIRSAARGRPHIFNLGHGITPDTPIDHVIRLIDRVRASA